MSNKSNKQKGEINLKTSINTDSVDQNIYSYGDPEAPHNRNTGIERDGGITNIYEKEISLSEGKNIVTEDNKIINFNSGLVTLDGKTIANVSPYGIEKEVKLFGYDDVVLSSEGTILAVNINSSAIQVSELDLDGVVLRSRSTIFSNLITAYQFYTSLSFVRYVGIKYSDVLEFNLRLGETIIIVSESTPGQSLEKSFLTTTVLGNNAVKTMCVYGAYLIVAGVGGRLGSFDGLNWKNYDGTGLGTGPYDNGTVIGTSDINCLASYNGNIIVAGAAGRVGSWDGASWKIYTTAGTGLWNNATVVSTDNITSILVWGNNIIFGGHLGKLGSWSGAAWVNYNAGSGLCDNATLIGASSINSMCVFKTVCIVAGDGGKIGNISATGTKAVYTVASTSSAPTNNATVIGANNINAVIVKNNYLFASGVGGRVGSFDGTAWTNYNAAGISDNSTLIGSSNINTMLNFDNYTVFAGADGRIASMKMEPDYFIQASATPTNIYTATPGADTLSFTLGEKFIYSGSAGIRSNQTAVGSNAIYDLETYNNRMMVGAATATVGAMNADYSYSQFWTGATLLANLLAGFNSYNYLYTYRYENGRYLINLVGNTNNVSYDINNTSHSYISLRARYAIPQVSQGKTRHIITGDPVYDASKIESIGLHGYTDFVTYTSTVAYPSALYASITSVPQKNVGFGAVDHNFIIGSSIYNWTPQYKTSTGSLYQVNQSNTDILINAYGKLTNNYNLAPSVPFEIRIGWINGVQSYLSAARISGPFDNLGTIVTNVGEFDDTYTPQVESDSLILYKYNNSYFIKKIGVNCENRLQQLDQHLYKINTISPYNIIDTNNATIDIGSSDFNGRMLFTNTSATAIVAQKAVTLFKRKYSNSIDPGDKLVKISNLSKDNIEIIGFRIADSGNFNTKFILDTFIEDLYSYSTFADGSEFVDPVKTDTLYIPDAILPVRIGAQYEAGAAKTLSATLLLDPLFDGYKIGNEIEGSYRLFDLYGQQYSFDGKNIYIVNEQNGVFDSVVKVCDAFGMVYIASSPTTIFFFSDFDNSVYTFDGGRSANKFKRLNTLPQFINGVYSTKDNTLLLETTDSFVWMRDGVWTENSKKASQTSLKLYSTVDGIVIGNDSNTWRYNYTDGQGYTIVPLEWKSAFIGSNQNEKSILSEYVYTIYNENKQKMSIIGTIYSFDESDNYHEEQMKWEIDSPDYSSEGYCKLRAIPQKYRPLASSLQLEFNDKVVLYEVVAEFGDSSNAKIEAKKTR